jgi:rubredoxin
MAEGKNYVALALALLSTAAISACSSKLKDVEKEGLNYIYEVEKLARDVYRYSFDKWGTYVLDTISNSEQAHMNIVKELIDAYGIDNPAEDNNYGEFNNSELQALYNELKGQSASSEAKALEIAAMVEEIDIVDIKKYLEQTDKDNIDTAFNKLVEGSNNHLRIFVNALSDKGISYQPQYLSQQDYNKALSFTTTIITTTGSSSSMTAYYCQTPDCGYVYDPKIGDPDGGIPAGSAFEDIPDDWRCPVCGATKASFKDYPVEH